MITLWALNSNGNEWFSMKDRIPCPWSYLDGKLERMNGYDRFVIDRDVYETLKAKAKGTEPVLVNLSNGEVVGATFYFWTYIMEDVQVVYSYSTKESIEYRKKYPMFRGLVVLDNDKESVKYAKEMQAEESWSI